MSLANFLIVLALGKAVIWLLMNNGLIRHIKPDEGPLSELFDCGLCLGFWVYLILSPPSPFGVTWHTAETILFAALASFAAHLLTLGWGRMFGEILE